MVDISLDRYEEEPDIATLRKVCIDEIKYFKRLKEKHGKETFMNYV